jgi:hypothetical protein
MLNVNELEQKWFKYKIKSYIPHVVIVISSTLIIILLYILLNSNYFSNMDLEVEVSGKPKAILNDEIQEKKAPEPIEPVVAGRVLNTPSQENIILEAPKSQTPTVTEQKFLIAPSMNFIKNIQHDDVSYNKTQATIPVVRVETPHQSAPTPEYIEETVLTQPIMIEEKRVQEKDHQVNTINIKRQNEYSDIEEIITRFKKSNNPALSLFIAKKYYELGEYRNAYNYSLITNELNKDIEASWILFAQSLVKLNEKDKAVKVLQDYIKHTNSNRANLLLNDILSGKFK